MVAEKLARKFLVDSDDKDESSKSIDILAWRIDNCVCIISGDESGDFRVVTRSCNTCNSVP